MRKRYRIAAYAIRQDGEITWKIQWTRLGFFWKDVIAPGYTTTTWTMHNLAFAQKCVKNLEEAENVRHGKKKEKK